MAAFKFTVILSIACRPRISQISFTLTYIHYTHTHTHVHAPMEDTQTLTEVDGEISSKYKTWHTLKPGSSTLTVLVLYICGDQPTRTLHLDNSLWGHSLHNTIVYGISTQCNGSMSTHHTVPYNERSGAAKYNVYMCVHLFMCVYVCAPVCVYVCVCGCACVLCMHAYVCLSVITCARTHICGYTYYYDLSSSFLWIHPL